VDAGSPSERHDDEEMFLTHTNASDAELIARLILGCLIAIAPFLAFSLVLGYVAGRFVKDPWTAAFASGFLGLLSFWGSLVAAIAIFVGNGAGAGVAFVLTVFFLVAMCLALVFVALAYVMYRNRRAKLSSSRL
jgi:hypothetical protein